MTKGVFDAFHYAGEFSRIRASYAGAANGQIDDFRNGEQADDHGNKIETVPKVKRAESVTEGTGLRIDTDGGQHQTNAACQKTLDQRGAGECADESDAHDRDDKEFR